MSVVRYQPWSLLNEMNKVFERNYPVSETDTSTTATSEWTPRVDIQENKNEFVIHADIPGVDPKDIKVHMENGVLTIEGERESKKEDIRDSYKRIEREYGSFYRRFSLPDTADAEGITAKGKHGVLEIMIPKSTKSKARTIAVKVE